MISVLFAFKKRPEYLVNLSYSLNSSLDEISQFLEIMATSSAYAKVFILNPGVIVNDSMKWLFSMFLISGSIANINNERESFATTWF